MKSRVIAIEDCSNSQTLPASAVYQLAWELVESCGVSLGHAQMQYAIAVDAFLVNADLSYAKFREANLTGVCGLTKGQIERARVRYEIPIPEVFP